MENNPLCAKFKNDYRYYSETLIYLFGGMKRLKKPR